MGFSGLIGKCITDLIKSGVKVEIHPEKEIDCDGLGTAGYFDDSGPTLCLATGGPGEWQTLFLHEYCHFLQWREGQFESFEGIDNLDDWYAPHPPYEYEIARNLTRISQMIERDCEQRVVKLIKKHKLPVDISDYIKGANAYLYLYQLCLEKRKWMTAASYKRPKLKEYCPDSFQSDYSVLPKGFRRYASRWCF